MTFEEFEQLNPVSVPRFMRNHPSLVEDLTEASKRLSKNNRLLSDSLARVAEELKELDPIHAKEYISPF